jgi:predicted membrane-bound spermidine synthase
MKRNTISGQSLFFVLFAVSGFAGLVYESIWSHYLKLFLGHAAYAQVLVLIIFMGGMALGSWLVGRYTSRIRSLLRYYALAEGIIGVLAILFHPMFNVMDSTYLSIIPHVDSAVTASIIKWGLASLLILPQSVLLGATFPLMSGGVIRRYPDKPGRSLAILYFTNSLGAAVGVLVSGFLLIGSVGLPGTIITAGIINIILAVVVFHLSKTEEQPVKQHKKKKADVPACAGGQGGELSRNLVMGFILVAAFTGAASFLYEIGWIRMLSLVLGSSTHSFELMLSAFILGLAIGGYWISRRIDVLENPMKRLAYIQLFMGGLALMTLVSYGEIFNLMGWAVKTFPKTGQGYFLFNLVSHGISMLIMIPATVCAGMTLPLITYYLLYRGYGEGAIGKVYAANTIGSIVGVVLGLHFIMPLLGVKNVIVVGGGIDIVLGIILLWYAVRSTGKVRWGVITAVFTAVVLLAVFVIRLDHTKMASGVYKDGRVKTDGNIVFHRDGKTASVDLIEFPSIESRSITVNGKSDAAISYSSTPRPDELTMVLLAALPMSFNDNTRTAANIGLGSGLTSQVVLMDPGIESVDTIEIEPAVVEGARFFGERVEKNFKDPRSRIHIEDAKTFFHSAGKQYDIIISEPSNPWISGISSLFSVEFYGLVRRFIKDDGVFCQWVHLYEMNIPLVASVIKAISANFEDYAVYFTTDTNIVILASRQPLRKQPSEKIFDIPGVKRELARIGIFNVQDLQVRKLGTRKTLDVFFHSYDIPANSDFFPVLDMGAARTRYLGLSAKDLNRLFPIDTPFMPILEGDEQPVRSFYSTNPFGFWQAIRAKEARAVYQYFISLKNPNFVPTAAMSQENFKTVQAMISGSGNAKTLLDMVYVTLAYLSKEEMALVWDVMESSTLYQGQSPELKRVLSLYKALSNRNFREVVSIAGSFLSEGTIIANDRNNFLVKVILLAHIVLGDNEAARKIWERYDLPEQVPVELRLLGAMLQKPAVDD